MQRRKKKTNLQHPTPNQYQFIVFCEILLSVNLPFRKFISNDMTCRGRFSQTIFTLENTVNKYLNIYTHRKTVNEE